MDGCDAAGLGLGAENISPAVATLRFDVCSLDIASGEIADRSDDEIGFSMGEDGASSIVAGGCSSELWPCDSIALISLACMRFGIARAGLASLSTSSDCPRNETLG